MVGFQRLSQFRRGSDGEAELHADRAVRESGRAVELIVDLLFERGDFA